MIEKAIIVKNLSKRYRIGLKEKKDDTFVGAVGSILKSPFQNLKRLQNLTHFTNVKQNSDDIIWALKDVSFEVKKGEVIGVIGANGAGKSTLLKILAQITHPTTGSIELNGRVASLLEVGTGFHPELTGRENIYLNGTILGMTKKEIDFNLDEIVEFSGVEKFLDTPVKRYSSGMRVRLAFSVAAHLEPEILLIDEVLAVGDAQFQKKCLGKMDAVAKGGRTVLFVSHNMSAIKSLCKKSILFSNGILAGLGETNKVIYNYLNVNNGIEVKKSQCGSDNALTVSDSVKLISIRLIDDENKEIEILNENSMLGVEIIYMALDLKTPIVPSVNIYNNYGEILFSSINRNFKKGLHSNNGNHSYTLWIPKNTFSTGYFKVGVILSSFAHTNSERLIQTKEHLSFEVNDKTLNEIVGENGQGKESFLRPQFEWVYKKPKSNE